ncbi:MAG: putative DNA binding domain-containing protein [Cytophagales bacterium]|jgi:ATP-dependent DNA helicase RecG|nr:putative DNA binding domain-containing protein [Cytophagales bacterium]MCA6373226.1 putative DNA binding domain-containing protein [Cytophagales bacterium]MCA6377794.1 putative DNA binding domain-containing protein [Cytophagales bacterium]MCA6386227.1 putative DNA binding domain-containing protein [Cytophagales bacterium]
MNEKELHAIIDRMLKLPKECEWAEFKLNLKSEEEIGKYISALSNGACLQNEQFGYLVFGINDKTLLPDGTTFRPKLHKVGNEELENWLMQRLSPRVEVLIFETIYQEKLITLFQIQAANGQPTCFSQQDHIRVGSITRSLKDFPEKEKKIWTKGPRQLFEKMKARQVESAADVVSLLDTQCYFDLLKVPYPSTRDAVIEKFQSEKFIKANANGYIITNLGALLFAKNIQEFDTVKRKAPRVIQYDGKGKVKTLKDQEGKYGYAVGFERMIKYINDVLPSNEIIGQALRDNVSMYPEIAIRELVANALIHQDFEESGTGPVIEIYSDRIEISNPGLPLITPIRFIDECQSRNEDLAGIMRRFRICEEKGSGIDKVVTHIEIFQLPAYDVHIQEKHTKVVLYAYQKFSDMDKKDRIRACYQHACLKYVMNEKMTNTTLRERFKIADENAAMVSRMIKDTVDAKLIKEDDPENTSRKFVRYIPIWA